MCNSATYSFTATSDRNLIAHFTLEQYTVAATRRSSSRRHARRGVYLDRYRGRHERLHHLLPGLGRQPASTRGRVTAASGTTTRRRGPGLTPGAA